MTTGIERPLQIESGDMVFKPWIHHEAIQRRVAQMAGYLATRFNGQDVRFLPILKGALPFSRLMVAGMSRLPYGPSSITIDTIQVKSYQGTRSRELSWLQVPQSPAHPKVHDVLLEDIADSARTLTAVETHMRQQGGASLTTAVLLDRPAARAPDVDYKPDLVGFGISNPEAWAIGFGLDLGEQYRDLPDIYGRVGPDGKLPPYIIPPLPDV
ncbi:MAG TPA: phosphoribosyltransferase family protein [Candidatus Saccharimonadales bacterium]|nr:phosphoribosyltransferase family protein [Candidatus Saccharimonadales bacterium]